MWIALIVVVVLLIVWIIGVYNNLVSLKMRVKNAWAQIDTQLKRRFDLIPNLVETVKGYAAHEQGTLEKVIAARNTYASATSVEDKAKANNELTSTLKSIFALGEAYPELKANENFLNLQDELAGTENRVATARKDYNDAVKAYNTKIQTIPSNIIANMMGKQQREYFEVSDESKKDVPVVDFSE